MKRKYKRYTDNDIRKYAAEVTSMAQLLTKLGLKVAGGNFNNIRRKLQQLGLSCDHWTGQAWSKEKRLKDWSEYTKVEMFKPHLIKERGHQCERCKNTIWENVPIPLEVEHVNGDRADNRLENLKLLCCNCHALTSTWRGKKNRKSDASVIKKC
jgi:hypothetical protein